MISWPWPMCSRGSVLAEEYRENGVYYKATVKVDDLHRFEAYLL